jgi:hypothetical protein
MNKYLQLRYSLYERTTTGYQWTWRAVDLKDTLLDDFRYRIHMPDDAKDILPSHLFGGVLKFSQVKEASAEEHIVFYRFFNGGSDGGRSRVTMLAAWTTKEALNSITITHDILAVFRNDTFVALSEKSKTIGIEQPYSLISNEPIPTAAGLRSTSLEEFLNGLNDENHDYLLTIRNDKHQLTKTPSAFLRFKESEEARIKQEDENRKAEKRKREDDEAWLKAAEKKKQNEEERNNKIEQDRLAKEQDSQKKIYRKARLWKNTKTISAIIICAVVSILAFKSISDLLDKPKLPDVENITLFIEIKDKFMMLSDGDKAKLLHKLQAEYINEKKLSPNPSRPSNRDRQFHRSRTEGFKGSDTDALELER